MNSRNAFTFAGFQDQSHKPLGHVSMFGCVGEDSNLRSPAYEASEMTTSLPRNNSVFSCNRLRIVRRPSTAACENRISSVSKFSKSVKVSLMIYIYTIHKGMSTTIFVRIANFAQESNPELFLRRKVCYHCTS